MATGYWVRTIKAFEGQSASGNSIWFLLGRLLSPTVTIEGLESGGSISIRVSNRPSDADTGSPHATLGNVTSDGGGGLGGAFTWVRVVKTAGTSPTPTYVYFQAQQAK
jgi:hypothetical protein